MWQNRNRSLAGEKRFLWENSAQAITITFDTRTWAHERTSALCWYEHSKWIYIDAFGTILTQITWTVTRTFQPTIDFSHLFRFSINISGLEIRSTVCSAATYGSIKKKEKPHAFEMRCWRFISINATIFCSLARIQLRFETIKCSVNIFFPI